MKKMLLLFVFICSVVLAKATQIDEEYGPLVFNQSSAPFQKTITVNTPDNVTINVTISKDAYACGWEATAEGDNSNLYGIHCTFYSDEYPTGVEPMINNGCPYNSPGYADLNVGGWAGTEIESAPMSDNTVIIEIYSISGAQYTARFSADFVNLGNDSVCAVWGVTSNY